MRGLLFYQASPGGILMAHVHGFLSGELGLFENLESRGGEKKILLQPSLSFSVVA